MRHFPSVILLLAAVSTGVSLHLLFSRPSQSQPLQLAQASRSCSSLQVGRAANRPPDPAWESIKEWDDRIMNRQDDPIEKGIKEETTTAVAFSPNGQYLATGTKYVTTSGTDTRGKVKVWVNLEALKRKRYVLHESDRYINAVAFSPNGALLASADDKGSILVWNRERFLQNKAQPIAKLTQYQTFSVAFSPNNQLLAVGGIGGTNQRSILRWKITDSAMLRPMPSLEETRKAAQSSGGSEKYRIDSVAFSPNAKVIAGAGLAVYEQKNVAVRVTKPFIDFWQAETGKYICTLERSEFRSTSIAFSPDGTVFAAADRAGGLVQLWSLPNLEPLPALKHGGSVNAIAFSPSGNLLLSGGSDRKIKLWRVKTAQEIASPKDHAGEVTAVTFRSDGKAFASGSTDKSFRTFVYPK